MTNKNSESNLHIHESKKYSLRLLLNIKNGQSFHQQWLKRKVLFVFFIHSPRFSGYYDTSIYFVLEIGIIISRTALRSLLAKMANLGYSQGSIRRGLESAQKF